MKLAATGKPKRDAYYEDTFRKMLSGQKYVWNWSASLLGYYWFLYRKVYGSYFLVFLALSILTSILFRINVPFIVLIVESLKVDVQTAELIMGISYLVLLVSFVIFQGLMGNRFYLWSLKCKMRRRHHKATLENRDDISVFLAMTGVICYRAFFELTNLSISSISYQQAILCLVCVAFVLPRILFVIFNDRRKVKMALKNDLGATQ